MSAFVDTNILVRHLTGDPADMAARATAYLAETAELYLTDLIVAETVYVLESFYEAPREQVATAMRSLVSMKFVVTVDPALLLRAIEVYATARSTESTPWTASSPESSRTARRSSGVVSPDHARIG